MADALVRWLTPRSMLWRHALAVLFVAIAFLLTILLRSVAPSTQFILFTPAVMFAAWFGGLAGGLTASVLTVILAALYLLPPGSVIEGVALSMVAAVVTVATSILTAGRHRAEEAQARLLADEQGRRTEAESLSQAKSNFLTQLGHELRQPLSAMAPAIRLLHIGDERARERALRVIERQTLHVSHLVDDLLDLSRVQRKQVELHKVDVDLCDIVQDAVQAIEPALADRGIQLSSSIPDCPLQLQADATRLRQVFWNLLSNAAKFTERGGRIDLVIEPDASNTTIRILDTGRGIPPDVLPVIFELFRTGDGEAGGLGVGLAVVKAFVEMHGGTVRATSPGLGRGSEFIVTLPTVQKTLLPAH